MSRFFVLVRPVADEADRTTADQADAAYAWLTDRETDGRFAEVHCFRRTGGYVLLDLDTTQDEAAKWVEEMFADYPLRATIEMTVDEEVPLATGFATLRANQAAAAVGSVFNRIGGAAAVQVVVADLYRRVLGDPLLEPRFRGVDMAALELHQRQFVTTALGGPEVYRGRTLEEAHAGLRITDTEFLAVGRHLADALRAAGVTDDLVGQIVAAVVSLRPHVVATG